MKWMLSPKIKGFLKRRKPK